MITSAMSGAAGKPSKKVWNAASAPADAPMPTTGNSSELVGSASPGVGAPCGVSSDGGVDGLVTSLFRKVTAAPQRNEHAGRHPECDAPGRLLWALRVPAQEKPLASRTLALYCDARRTHGAQRVRILGRLASEHPSRTPSRAVKRNDSSVLPIQRARHWPRATLRTHLLVITLAATLPLVLLMLFRTIVDGKAQRDGLADNLSSTARVVATAVERELIASQDSLIALAEGEALQRGDVEAFERRLRSRGLLRPSWSRIALIGFDGGLLFQTDERSGPGDKAAPMARSEIDALVAAWSNRRSGDVVVSVFDVDPARRATWIGVPTTTRSGERHLLAARVGLAEWQAMLDGNEPEGGYIALFDRDRRVLARTLAPERFVGASLPASAIASMGSASSGRIKTALLGGGETYVAWQLIRTGGWGVGVGIPSAGFDGAQESAVLWTFGVTAACLLLGVSLSLLIARRVSEPLRRLALDRQPIGQERIAVTEIAQLRDAFHVSEWARKEALAELAKKAEEFETLFHTCPTGLAFAQDPACGVVLSNAAMDDLMPGAGVAASALEVEFWRAGRRIDAAQQPLAIAASERRDVAATELEVRRPGRPPAFVLASAVSLPEGRGALAAVTDMTARRLAENERDALMESEKLARREAEAASHAKDELLSMLGHELRNPLNAIVTSVEVLRAAPAGSPVAESARGVLARQTRKLAAMVDELLDVGQVMADEVVLSIQPIELGALVEGAVANARDRARDRSHELTVVAEANVWVRGDARRLGQVMAHLLDNAITYTPPGGRIEVSLKRNGNTASVRVEDNGPGIDAELLPHVFEAFVQGKRGNDRSSGGLGVGLAIVSRLVDLHGGSVQAHSAPTGSAFEWQMPTCEPASLGGRHHGQRIGLVDDNPDTLASMRAMLELAGHSVSTATDGPSGVEMLLADLPDVALIDIGLPGFDGCEVARRCRDAGYRGRMIALSGYGLPHDLKRSIADGFDAHLVKPIDPERLLPLLHG